MSISESLAVILPENQRLRFLYKNQVIVLFHIASTGVTYDKKVVLMNDESAKPYAKINYVLNEENKKIIQLDQTSEQPPDSYYNREIDFDADDCSFWNEYGEGVPQIVIGTGDIRNYSGTEMDGYLLTWTIPKAADGAIWVHWEDVNLIKIYSKNQPS